MNYIKLAVLTAMVLAIVGCSEEGTYPRGKYEPGTVAHTVNNDQSIHIIWNKLDTTGTLLLTGYAQEDGVKYGIGYYTDIDNTILYDNMPVISNDSGDNGPETITIDCIPQLRTSTYTTYDCNSSTGYNGHFVLPMTQDGGVSISEEYLVHGESVRTSEVGNITTFEYMVPIIQGY